MNTLYLFFTNTFFLIWVGAVSGHILSLYASDFVGTKPFFEKIIPSKTDTFYYRLDFIILPVIGTVIAFVLLEPNNLKASFFSGLSWSGTLVALLRKNSETVSKQNENE